MAKRIPTRTPNRVMSVKEAVSEIIQKKDAMQWSSTPKTTQTFLNSLETALWSFHDDCDCEHPAVDREYRNAFSYSYIHFFTKLKAGFAYGIIMGLSRVRDGLVVNCTKWLITDQIQTAGDTLEAKWEAIMHLIHSIRWASDMDWNEIEQSYVPHLRSLLLQFDAAYRRYEQALIPWLMEIEEHTRNFLSDVVESAEISPVRFIGHVASLNAQCNKRGNGRSDLSYDEVKMAHKLLGELNAKEGEVSQPAEHESSSSDARVHPKMRPLLEDLTSAFDDARDYFVGLKANLLCVDPQLSNNHELRHHCERFESAWERVRTLCSKGRWQLLSKAFAFLDLHGGSDADCSSVEGALAVPRLLLLASWDDASIGQFIELFSTHARSMIDDLREEYKDTYTSVEEALKALETPCDFMRKLEAASLHLQRDNSSEWNRFLQVLFQSSEAE